MNTIQRICLVTRQKIDRQLLLRIVKTPAGEIKIDPDYKLQGRGAYVTNNKECIDILIKKNLLQRALRCNISNEFFEQLKNYL